VVEIVCIVKRSAVDQAELGKCGVRYVSAAEALPGVLDEGSREPAGTLDQGIGDAIFFWKVTVEEGIADVRRCGDVVHANAGKRSESEKALRGVKDRFAPRGVGRTPTTDPF
jgi:hypothetical protein